MSGRGVFWAVLALVVVVASLVGLGAWGALAYTGSPDFCASCHVMETRHVSWRRSPHFGKATCIQCHSEPGTLGEVKAHLDGTRYLYVMLTGEKSGPILRAEVASATCEQCHLANTLAEASPMLLIRHRLHQARAIECTACHEGLVHGTMQGRPARAPAERCASCHTPGDPRPSPAARPPGWRAPAL